MQELYNMNRTRDVQSDDYANDIYRRSLSRQRFEPRPPKNTHNLNPDRQLFKPAEDMAPFNDQPVQYNILKPYKNPAQAAWNQKYYK